MCVKLIPRNLHHDPCPSYSTSTYIQGQSYSWTKGNVPPPPLKERNP